MMSNIISFSDKFIIHTSIISVIISTNWVIFFAESHLENLEINILYIVVNISGVFS